MNAITQLHVPLGGERSFGDEPVAKRAWGILVPQMVLWVAVTVVLGLVVSGTALLTNSVDDPCCPC